MYDNSVKLLELIFYWQFAYPLLEPHSTFFICLKSKLKMDHNEKKKACLAIVE